MRYCGKLIAGQRDDRDESVGFEMTAFEMKIFADGVASVCEFVGPQ